MDAADACITTSSIPPEPSPGATTTLLTVTVRSGDSDMFPDRSVACTCSVCMQLGRCVVSQTREYGATVTEPSSAPSARMDTSATPPSSVASATTGTRPETTPPSTGDVTDACGGVVSGTGTAAIGNSARMPTWSEDVASPGGIIPKRDIDCGGASSDHA